MTHISSTQNPSIKQLTQLIEKSSFRKSSQLFALEGIIEMDIALNAGYELVNAYVLEDGLHYLKPFDLPQALIYTVNLPVFEKIAVRHNPKNVVCVFKAKNQTLADYQNLDLNLVMILEGIEKPGNIGALLRTADATGVDLVVWVDCPTDRYNPHVLRNSLGCALSVDIVVCQNREILDFLNSKLIQILSAYLHTEQNFYSFPLDKPTAMVFGTESTGISSFWVEHCDALVKIPMLGKIDSLNVSNAASVMLYEYVRQRQFA
ncbi:MAG: hypothetical protein MUE53_08070 [Chitinophagales bacterium]|nr:hypothetical protein [Chitinophagales bacterium]